MEFWATQPQAWAEATARPRCPATVMNEYVDWLAELGGVPVFVGFPAVFDFGFVNHYLLRYCGHNPFRRNAVDIRSFAMGVLGRGWRQTRLSSMPAQWTNGWKHEHTALGDALEQGQLFMSIRKTAMSGMRSGGHE